MKTGRPKEHGHASGGRVSLTYQVWDSMKQRCENPNAQAYPSYGGRGIKICKRWHKFKNFLADMGEKPTGKQLDRKNNDGNYEPSNCRWATRKQQANNRRNSRKITYKGKTRTVAQWSQRLGMKTWVLYDRLGLGWSTKKALETPYIRRK